MSFFKRLIKGAALPADYVVTTQKVAKDISIAGVIARGGLHTFLLFGRKVVALYRSAERKRENWELEVYRTAFAENQEMTFVKSAEKVEAAYVLASLLSMCFVAAGFFLFFNGSPGNVMMMFLCGFFFASLAVFVMAYFVLMLRQKMLYPYNVFLGRLLAFDQKAWFPLGVK